MPAPERVRAWIAQNYQKPTIDQEWLAECSDWIAAEFSLDPNKNFDPFIQHVESQLLQSNLTDSTVIGSGIDPLLVASNSGQAIRPPQARRPGCQTPPQRKTTGPIPLLVEVKSITEIAHSAFSLLNTHQTRLDRADLGLAREGNAEQPRDEDEGPVPRFPRGMLKFELSDGSTTFRAIEFRSLPQLELGTTPLGYKMFLKSTPIRGGVAFLEPENVVLKGYRTEDHDVHREQVFLSSLRRRLGRPDPPPEPPATVQQQPAPVQLARQHQPPPADIDDMDDIDPDVLREMDIQMDGEMHSNQRPGIRALPPASPPSISKERQVASSDSKQTLQRNSNNTIFLEAQALSPSTKTSPYFTAESSKSDSIPNFGLSPRPVLPPSLDGDVNITWDSDEANPPKRSAMKPSSTSSRPLSIGPHEAVRHSSPDPFDDLSFDTDMDFERLDIIEQNALGTGANKGKGKGKDTGTGNTVPNVRPVKVPSGSVLGTKRSAPYSVSSSAEPSARTRRKRAISVSPLGGSSGSPTPQSTQLSSRRLARDPSLIVISSEDETPGSYSKVPLVNLARGRAKKASKTAEVEDPDVIDITD